MFRDPLFAVIIAPKRKCSDAGSASKPKRSRDVLAVSEKVKILDMINIDENHMRRLPCCMVRRRIPFLK